MNIHLLMYNQKEIDLLEMCLFNIENLKYFLENSSINSIGTISLVLIPDQIFSSIFIYELNGIIKHGFLMNSQSNCEQFFNSSESYHTYLFQSKIKPNDLKLLNSFFFDQLQGSYFHNAINLIKQYNPLFQIENDFNNKTPSITGNKCTLIINELTKIINSQ